MLNQLQSLTEYVGGNNALIDQWLQARKQLLIAYYHLVGIKPNKDKHTPLDEQALDNFCHNLVDYLSACHFHVYERILQVYERILQEAVALSDQKLAQTHRLALALQANTQFIHYGFLRQQSDDRYRSR
ncbi:MAG: Rsd/AlgQ family anti-sigma factor [Symbiopectobacterium sp.]